MNYFVASQKQITLIHVYLILSLQNKNMIDEMIFLKMSHAVQNIYMYFPASSIKELLISSHQESLYDVDEDLLDVRQR